MSNSTNMNTLNSAMTRLALGYAMVNVEALIQIEHNRKPRVPGTESAFFQVKEDVAQSLESIGAIRRVDVLDTATLPSDEFEGPGAVTMADVADVLDTRDLIHRQPMFDPQAVLAQVATLQDQLAQANDAAAAERSRADELQALLDAVKVAGADGAGAGPDGSADVGAGADGQAPDAAAEAPAAPAPAAKKTGAAKK